MFHMETTSNVILLVDVDCFEVQVWQKNKELKVGNPCLVANENGMILSVNHAAKSRGISRKGMNMKAAVAKCAELEVIQIPNRYGKPDNRPPRLASYLIADKVKEFFAPALKKNCTVRVHSKDEFFIDVTHEVAYRMQLNSGSPSEADLLKLPIRTHLLHHRGRITQAQKGFHHRIFKVLAKSRRPYHREELALIHGAIVTNELIQFLKSETGFQCSGGVGHNSLTAKLACGLSKPAGIAILPTHAIEKTSKFILIPDIPELGGIKGKRIMQQLKIRTMYELSQNLTELKGILDEQEASYFHSLARGLSSQRIVEKVMSESISCGKSFKGRRRIDPFSTIFQHLYLLLSEMDERLEEERVRNFRKPTSFRFEIKGCKPTARRDKNLKKLLGQSVSNEDFTIDKSELFSILKSKISDSTLCDDDAPNIVELNLIAKF